MEIFGEDFNSEECTDENRLNLPDMKISSQRELLSVNYALHRLSKVNKTYLEKPFYQRNS